MCDDDANLRMLLHSGGLVVSISQIGIGQVAERKHPRQRVRVGLRARSRPRALLLVSALMVSACGADSESQPLAFPGEPSGQLSIGYPLDETLFPPDVAAPTFVWSDETEGAARWQVLLRLAEGHSRPASG